MAAAALEPVAQAAAARAATAFEEFKEDPIEYAGKKARSWGLTSLIGGVVCWIGKGWFQRMAQSADQDAASRIGSIGAVFSNATTLAATVSSWFSLVGAVTNVTQSPPVGSLSVACDNPDGTNLPAPFAVTISVLDPNGNPVTDANGLKWDALVFATGKEYGKSGGNFGPTWNSNGGPVSGTGGGSSTSIAGSATAPSPTTANIDIPDAFSGFVNDNTTYAIQISVTEAGYGVARGTGTINLSLEGVTAFAALPPPGQSGTVEGFQPYQPYKVTVTHPTNIIGQIFGDIAAAPVAIADLPKALFASLVALPFLIADGTAYLVASGVGAVMTYAWLPLMILGVALLGFSWFALAIYPKVRDRVHLLSQAKSAKLWRWIDSKLRTRRNAEVVLEQKATEVKVQAALTPVEAAPAITPVIEIPPVVVAPAPSSAEVEPKSEVGSAELRPGETKVDEPTASLPPEDYREPTATELEAQEKARRESLIPDAPPAAPNAAPADVKPEEGGGDLTPVHYPSEEPATPPKPKKRSKKSGAAEAKRAHAAFAAIAA